MQFRCSSMMILLGLLLFISARTAGQCTSGWTWYGSGASPQPSSVTSNTSGAHPGPLDGAARWANPTNGDLYVFGGSSINPSGSLSLVQSALWRWTRITATWSLLGGSPVDQPQIPLSLSPVWPQGMWAPLVAQLSNGDVLLFGGMDNVTMNNFVWRFYLATESWSFLFGVTSAPLGPIPNYSAPTAPIGQYGVSAPTARVTPSGAVDNSDRLWIYGGYASYLSPSVDWGDVWSFDPSAGTWAYWGTQPPLSHSNSSLNQPGIRNAQVMAFAGNSFWVFGGNYGVVGNTEVWQLSLNGTWSYVSGCFSSQGGCAAAFPACNSSFPCRCTAGPSACHPPPKDYASVWSNRDDAFFLFGGASFVLAGYTQLWNDVWMFNITENRWSWLGGSNAANAVGTYSGSPGNVSQLNSPGARFSRGVNAAYQPCGRVYIYGGTGYSASSTEVLGDLWIADLCWLTGGTPPATCSPVSSPFTAPVITTSSSPSASMVPSASLVPSVSNQATLFISGPVVVNGSFAQSPAGTLVLAAVIASNVPLITVLGCSNVSGALVLQLNRSVVSDTLLPLLSSPCLTGTFDSISVTGSSTCVRAGAQSQSAGILSVFLQSCSSLNVPLIIGLAGAGLLVLASAAVASAILYRRCRPHSKAFGYGADDDDGVILL
jgi:hypothetical protein